ncbi:carboxyl-terminal processing protease [Luteibacter sp. 621]|uniref:carboxy terminal-processing peptidase n=1 Tax=Luteibacter sp. 621 TaxID=3373916 RepID=UPI003D233AE1
MRPSFPHRLIGIASILVVAASGAAAGDTSPGFAASPTFTLSATDDQAAAAKVAMLFMTRYHYRPRPLDEDFSRVVFDDLIDELDPQRTVFTADDIARFGPLRATLGASIDRGDLSAAFEPINVYLGRVAAQASYSEALLGTGFDFTEEESVQVDRKDAPWPSSMNALHELWREHAKDDWLRLKLAGKDDATIRQTLARRYRNLAARVGKTTADDALPLFMTAYAESTDPHTDYFSPKAAAQFNSEMSLSLDGIGAYLRVHDEYVEVTELVAGSPAMRSGKVRVGDRVTGVGQGASGAITDVVGWRTDDVVTLIRGKAGTDVRLELLPAEGKGDAAPRTVLLTRRKVTIEDQAARMSVIDVGHGRKIGVVSVPSFYEDFEAKRAGDANYRSVTRDVGAMLAKLKTERVDGVVVDLRNNGGGSLDEAQGLVGLFAGAGPVVQVRDAVGAVDVQHSPDSAALWTGPLGVLVNRGSASASEIFAAALQDRARAVVVGEQTFGKGTVQNLVDLDDAIGHGPDGKLGELKLTIAQFYRIDGVSTQRNGVVPDIVFPDMPGDFDLGEATYKNALPASTIEPVAFEADVAGHARLALLSKAHDVRVANSPRWKLELDEAAAVRTIAGRSTLSLNLASRKASRESDLHVAAGLAARRRALDAAAGLPVEQDGVPKGDDGLDATERGADAVSRPRADLPRADAYLEEAAHIVEDDAALLMTVARSDADNHRHTP